MLAEKEIIDLIQNGEKVHFEGKDASGGLPRSLWETYSAFSNTDGGVIVLGLPEVDHKLTIKGVDDPSALIKQFWDTANNIECVSSCLMVDRNVYSLTCRGKQLVVLEVPRADRRSRPVYIGKDVFEGSYRRNGEGDYKCSRDSVLTMLRDSCEKTADTAVVDSLTLEDLNEESIRRYRMRFEGHKPDHSWNSLPVDRFLKNIGAARKDEKGVMRPTVAGLVCFGNFVDIIASLPNYFVDYRERNTDETRWSDRVCAQDGTWSGNIFDFFCKIRDRLVADVKKPFAIADDNVSRIEDTDVHKSVRELLANALIHADYYGRRGIVIEKRFRHLKFANPGAMLMSKEDAVSGGNTEPRNTSIFNIFSLVEIGERSGTGLSNLYAVCDRHGFAPATITETFDPDRTIVELELTEVGPETPQGSSKVGPSAPEMPQKCPKSAPESDNNQTINSFVLDNKSGLMSNFGNINNAPVQNPSKTRPKPVQNPSNQVPDCLQDCSCSVKQVYLAVQEDPMVTYRAMVSKLRLNKDTINEAIGTLVSMGCICRCGSKRNGHWEIVK